MITKSIISLFKWIIVHLIMIVTELFIPDFNYLGWRVWRTKFGHWTNTCMRCTKPKSKTRMEKGRNGIYHMVTSPLCEKCDLDLRLRYGTE